MIFETTFGRVTSEGVGVSRSGKPIQRFLGIPYARAERFQDPEPIAPIKGQDVNSGKGHCFPQHMPSTFMNFFLKNIQPRREWQPREDIQGEDSLRINVWTSDLETQKPVLVFLHGGDCGSGTTPIYDGAHLAEQDIVVVTITYRIGLFGHLHVVDGDRISCDRALLDQQLALRWIRTHIAEFGGDPDNITLMGHCSGAFYALHQILNPYNRDLFHRLILCSGQGITPNPLIPEKEREAFQDFLSNNRLSGYSELLSLPPEKILKLKPPQTFLSTTVDKTFFLGDPLESLEEGYFPRIPVIIGSASDELSMLKVPMQYKRLGIATSKSKFPSAVEKMFGPRAGEIAEALRPEADDVADLQIKMMELVMFHGPALNLMDRFSRFTDIYGYRFEYIPQLYHGLRGAFHGAEVAMFFDNLDRLNVPINDENNFGITTIQQDWLSFLYEGVIRERSYFDSEDTITHYRGQPKDIDFPHADLLRDLEGNDLANQLFNTFMRHR